MLNILSWLNKIIHKNIFFVSIYTREVGEIQSSHSLSKNQRWTARQRKSTFDYFVYNPFFWTMDYLESAILSSSLNNTPNCLANPFMRCHTLNFTKNC